jgi:hypothetical protein
MAGEPGLNGRGLTIRQQGYDTPTLKIADNRSVAVIAPECPVIDAHHFQWLRPRMRATPHDAQNSVIADGQHEAPSKAGGWSAAKRETQVMDYAIEPACSA